MRLPPVLCAALFRPLVLIAESREPDFVIGGRAEPYLRRWHVTPRGEGPAVYLHHFLRSDDDRALHDHPYESTSILLRGSYCEHLPGGAALREVGSVVQRDALTPHRVELLACPTTGGELAVWTLFLTGPRVRDWGFHCPNGWVRWQDFVDQRDGGAIGRGCGEP
jgi:hypothetical protein